MVDSRFDWLWVILWREHRSFSKSLPLRSDRNHSYSRTWCVSNILLLMIIFYFRRKSDEWKRKRTIFLKSLSPTNYLVFTYCLLLWHRLRMRVEESFERWLRMNNTKREDLKLGSLRKAVELFEKYRNCTMSMRRMQYFARSAGKITWTLLARGLLRVLLGYFPRKRPGDLGTRINFIFLLLSSLSLALSSFFL